MLHFNLRLFTMMNIRVKLLVAIILYQFFLFVHAQGLIDVRHYSIEDGLSQNIVQDMLQDDDGYIWLATWNGLEKYDGYTFKNYKSYPTDAIKLKYNRMVQVIKGSDHTLWCHTYDDKVYLFDTQRERFEDVFVYHKVYNIVKATLNIASRRDIKNYMTNLQTGHSSLLKNVTSGYRYHTVHADNEEILDEIQEELQKAGFLAQLQEYEPVDFWKDK